MKRWTYIALIVILLAAAASLLGLRIAAGMLKGKVAAALGPGSEIRELRVRWSSVEIVGLDIQGPRDWPAGQTLRAERVVIAPSLLSLFSDQIHVSSITLVKPYLSMLRTQGRLVMVPTLFRTEGRRTKKKPGEAPPSRTVTISKVALQDGVIELFDATVASPPLKVRLEQIEALVRNVVTPSFQGRTEFDLAAVVKGVRHDGRAKVSGWIGSVGKDSSSRMVLESVDLVSLQPYLVKSGEARISKGSLDLQLGSEVRNNRLNGKGRMILKQLEFAPSRSYLDTFMGISRHALIRFMQDHEGTIDVDFAVEGDIGNPRFSLNEAIGTRIAAAMAEQLGMSILGVAEGVGTLGRKGLEGAGEVTGTIGSTLKSLFGGEKKQ